MVALSSGHYMSLAAAIACTVLFACDPVPRGSVRGTAVLPQELDRAGAPAQADVIAYLRDLAPVDGVRPGPWDAPVVDPQRVALRSLTSREVCFSFDRVPVGEYAVFVLIDTGRPHVRAGSEKFPPRPGDYHGRTRRSVTVREGTTSEVRVEARIQVLVTEGYEAPIYLD
ncbi:MAG: hypothetical protein V3U43_06100 [Pseudomonadales bacterium]